MASLGIGSRPASSPASSAPSSAGRSLIAYLYVAYLLGFVDRVIFAMAMPSIKTALLLDDRQLGLLSGVAFASCYALFAPIAGFLADRGSRKLILIVAIGIWSCATAATALAHSFAWMFAARAVVGIGEAALMPVALSAIADARTGPARDQAIGLFLSAGAAGQLLALVLGGLLLHGASGGVTALPLLGPLAAWQLIFVVAGLVGLAFVAVASVGMREPSRSCSIDPRNAGDPRKAGGDGGTTWSFVRAEPMLIVTLIVGLALIQMATVTAATWVPTVLQRAHGWSTSQVGIRMGLSVGVTTLVGALAAGGVVRFFRGCGAVTAPLLTAVLTGTAFGLALAIGTAASSPFVALAFFALAFLFGYAPTVGAYVMMAECIPPAIRARIAGINILAVAIFCNSLGPYLVGLLSDKVFTGPRGVAPALGSVVVCGVAVGGIITLAGLANYRRRMAALRA